MKRTMRRLATIMMLVAATMMVTVGCGCSKKEEPKQVAEEPKASAPEKVVEEKEENFKMKFSEENQQTIFDFYIEEDKVFFEPEVEIVGEDGAVVLDKEPTKTVYRWSWADWKKSKEMTLEEKIEQLAETVDRVDLKKTGVYMVRYEFEDQKLDAATVYVLSKAEELNEVSNSADKTTLEPKVSKVSSSSKFKLDPKKKNTKKDSNKKNSSTSTKKPKPADKKPVDNPSGEDEADKKPGTYVADVSGIRYLGTEVTYDGRSHVVTVDKSTIPEGIVDVVVQNPEGGYTKAGSYEIPVKYSVKSNYKPIPNGVVRLTIKPKAINPDCKVTGTTVDYDGNAHGISIVDGSVTEGATFVRAENNSRTNAGSQVVTLVFEPANTNYTLTKSTKAVTLTVNPIEHPGASNIQFKTRYFKFYNTECSLKAENVPSDVTVSYSGNGQKEKGKWLVTAYFHVGPNYKPIPAKVAYIIITDSGDPNDGEPQPPKEDEEEEPENPDVKPGPGGVEEAGPTNSPTPTTPKEPNDSQEAATPTKQTKSTTSTEPSSYKAAEVTPEQSKQEEKDAKDSSDEKNDADKKTENSTNVEPKQEEKKAETKKEPQKAPKETTEAAEAPKKEEPKKVDPPKEEKKEEPKKQEPPVKEEPKKASDSGQEEAAENAE